MQRGHSPHHSVKVLPATPTAQGFPPNLRLVRGNGPPPISVFNEGMPANDQQPVSPSPFGAGGVLFAKRKRNLFKGPMVSGGGSGSRGSGSGSHSRSASASGLGRRSGEITIQEEEEDDEDDYVEEVENFTPVVTGPGERVEEQIIEEGEITPTAKPKGHDLIQDGPEPASHGDSQHIAHVTRST